MILALLSLLALGDAAAAGKGCDFVVDFGSVCCGPDWKGTEQVRNYLKANDTLVTGKEIGHGRKGERRFCIQVKNHMDLQAVYGHLTRIVTQPTGKKDVPQGTVANCRVPKPSSACASANPGE